MAKKHNPRAANGIDKFIGERIRAARNMKKISQADLGDACSVSFQQIQKREQGVNRISAAQLIETANALDVSVAWILEGAPGYDVGKKGAGTEDLTGPFFRLPFARDIAKDYIAIKSSTDRDVVRTVTHALASR